MVLDIAIVPLLALLAVLLGRVVAKAGIPDFLGFILAGALVALVLPQAATTGSALKGAATLGLVALMVGTGIGMSPHISGGRWRKVAALSVAILACLVPAFLTAPMVMRGWPDPALSAGRIPALAYQGALALAVIVTSVPFITKVLAHNRLLGTAFAATVLCTACTVDLVVWALVPMVIGIGSGGTPSLAAMLTPLFATAVLAGGSAAAVRAQAWGAEVSAIRFLLSALVPLAALAWSFVAFFDVSVMVAALIFGLSLGRLRFPRAALAPRLGRAPASLLVPLYFATVGLHLDLGEKLAPALLAIFFLWSTAIKAVTVTAAAALLKYRRREALAFGFALNTRGGPGIALASITFDAGVIGGATFVALVFASVASALLADRALQLTIAGRARTSRGAEAPSTNAARNPRGNPAEAHRVRISAVPQPREHT